MKENLKLRKKRKRDGRVEEEGLEKTAGWSERR